MQRPRDKEVHGTFNGLKDIKNGWRKFESEG